MSCSRFRLVLVVAALVIPIAAVGVTPIHVVPGGGGSESNNLESGMTGVLDDEVAVGTGAGTATYTPVLNCTDGTQSLDWNGTAFVCNTITGGSASNSFETWSVPAGTNPVADSPTDTVTWTCGTGLTCTGTAATDTFALTLAAGLVDLADGTLTATAVGTGLTDAQVSDTLTCSLFVGSGSTTTAIDLATAEIAGTLAAANVDAAIARLASPTFTGVPAAPTASSGTNTTQLATTAYVQTELGELPGAGLAISSGVLSTSSTETGFLVDGGAGALTCGASTGGRMQVRDDGKLDYCDGAATPVLRTFDPTASGAGDLTKSGAYATSEVLCAVNTGNGVQACLSGATLTSTGLNLPSNATDGGVLTLSEDSDLGTSTWKIALGQANLSANFSITPGTDGKLSGSSLLAAGSVGTTEVANLDTGDITTNQLARARGGTNSDTSAIGAGLFGSDAGNAFVDVDTAAELETALGGVNVIVSTEIDTVTELNALTTDQDLATLAGTETLTNKTLNVEAAGNDLTVVDRYWMEAAGCNNATASPLWDLPTANAPAVACVTGTNTQKAYADFDQTTDESMQRVLRLTLGFTGAIDANVKWLTTATTGSVAWCVQLVCVADGETDDPAFPAQAVGNCQTDAANGTTNQMNSATLASITATGCAAGELMHIRLSRDPDETSTRTDTVAADARLIGVELTLRQTQ